jgi:hypothetical protein
VAGGGAEIIVFNVHHHHGGPSVERVLLVRIFKVVMSAVEVAMSPE